MRLLWVNKNKLRQISGQPRQKVSFLAIFATGETAMPIPNRKIILLIAFILILLVPFKAVFAKTLRHAITTTVVSCICKDLVGYDVDMTRKCINKAINLEYSDGYISFGFAAQASANDATAVSFFGDGKKQIHQDNDTVLQPIDTINITFDGKTDTLKAVGTCLFTNPYKGSSIIKCSADASEGHFSGVFSTDGNEPITKQFK
jgi:hypothetical protein